MQLKKYNVENSALLGYFNPEGRCSQLLGGGSLKSQNVMLLVSQQSLLPLTFIRTGNV